ncbi:MAG: hypothetical protein Q9191_004152 [Dirinaria sp. TL-2023a]
MSILETPQSKTPPPESQRLRLELKEWEKAFATAHGGRKAGREDIKEHPEIAHKYKIYSKLRANLENHNTSSKLKKRDISPSRIQQADHTPLKGQKVSQPVHPRTLDPCDSPHSSHGPAPQLRTCIGPTPQKDGRVLGLFDLLSPPINSHNTPTKRTSLSVLCPNALETPTKHRLIDGVNQENSTEPIVNKPLRSPISSSKRAYLETFLTPSARRMVKQCTPASKSKLDGLSSDETPMFLRRDSQRAWLEPQPQSGNIDDEVEKTISWSPLSVHKRPKLAARGLSMLVKGLRDIEDEKLDEELALMREIEFEANEPTGLTATRERSNPMVEDSQLSEMPLGPDGAGSSDEGHSDFKDEGSGRDGKTLKVWKKKGQKRTTRKTNIKPSNTKWKPEPEWKADEEADGAADEPVLIAETQFLNRAAVADAGPPMDERDDMAYLEDAARSEVDNHETVNGKLKVSDAPGRPREKGLQKAKKIGPTAHANFRALKIKNKNSKAKRGNRFGRARR